jgi:hypothetical protein
MEKSSVRKRFHTLTLSKGKSVQKILLQKKLAQEEELDTICEEYAGVRSLRI